MAQNSCQQVLSKPLQYGMNDDGILAVVGSPTDETAPAQYFLYNLVTHSLAAMAIPVGFASVVINQVAGAGIILSTAFTEDFSRSQQFLFNADGTVRGELNAPSGTFDILFNNIGQAVGIHGDRIEFFDGSRWTEQVLLGLNGYTISRLSDFNDRGQIVGLVSQPSSGFAWGFGAHAVPEPSTLIPMILGLGPLAVLSLRQRKRAVVRG